MFCRGQLPAHFCKSDLIKFTFCCNSHVYAHRLSFLSCDVPEVFRFEFRHYFNLIFPSLEIQLWDDETSEILGMESNEPLQGVFCSMLRGFPRFLLESEGCAYMCIYCICTWCNLTYCANTSFRLVRIKCISEESCATAELCFPMCRSRWRWLRDSPRSYIMASSVHMVSWLAFLCGNVWTDMFLGVQGSTFVIFSLEVCLACRLSELDIRCCKAIGFHSGDCRCSSDCVLSVFCSGCSTNRQSENTPNFEERLQDLMESLNEGIVSAAEVQGGEKEKKRKKSFIGFFLGVVLEKDTLTCRIILSKKHMYSHMYLQDSTSKLGGPSKIMTIK